MPLKPVTIKEIAKILQVSTSTVSRALSDHYSIGELTKNKVRQLARQLNYEPNQKAVQLFRGKSYTIGVIVPDLSESFFSAAIDEIEIIADKNGYTVILAQSHDDVDTEAKLIERMKMQRVDGIIMSIAKTTDKYGHLISLNNLYIPIIFFDRIPPIDNINFVAANIEKGAFELTNYLIEKGHQNVAMINGPASLETSMERTRGYIHALASSEIAPNSSYMVNTDLTEDSTKLTLDKFMNMASTPTAIITFNDYIALYALRHIRLSRININNDVVIGSFANLSIMNYLENGPLASIEQFPDKQGKKAVEILFDLISQKNSNTNFSRIIINPEIRVTERLES